jgi:hypothetical protein
MESRMGKIILGLAVLVAVPAAASAQDFGTDWLDRVTHERQQERGPLKPHPVDWTLSTGILGYYDGNVFLADKDGKTPGDAVIVPFGRARLDYTEQRFEATADLLVDYKGYLDVDTNSNTQFQKSRDWEERFYGHARYVDARFTLGVDELLRHESDPVDAVFLTRAKRTVSDTIAHGTYDLTKTFTAEANVDFQVVRFEDKPLDAATNNENYRADLAIVYRQSNGYDWLLQVGWMSIYYNRSQGGGAPPDADGYFVRGGWRAELQERISVQAMAGLIHVESDRFLNTPDHEELTTMDILLAIQYEVTEQFRLTGDFNRTIGFATAPDPYQVVNRFAVIADWDAVEQLTIRARIQWDHAATPSGILREYRSYSLSASFRISEYVSADGGVTYRTGDIHGNVGSSVQFNDPIFHVGVILTY